MRPSTGCTRREFLAFAAAAGALSLVPGRAVARAKPKDERAEFFSSDEVRKIVIELDKDAVRSLRQEPRKYVKGTVREGDNVFHEVGIHIKGSAGSVRDLDHKPALTLNIAKFRRDQQFHGMPKLHLNNEVQDPSYTTDLLCCEMFRAAGVPASRFTHALVSLNDQQVGLYCVKEGYDREFLKESFGNAHGNFYDGGFLQEIDGQLKRSFGKQDVNDHSDLKKLLEAAGEENRDRRFDKLSRLLDLDRFISYLALEVISWDWDGYPLKRNNYRVYHDPMRDKITFIPHGMDQMFEDPQGPLFPDFQGTVARAFMETPEGRTRYVARVRQIMKDIFHPDELHKKLDALQARLKPAIESVDADGARNYPAFVDRVRQAITQRDKSLREQLEKAEAEEKPKENGQ